MDNKHKHLDYIQAIISRLADNSFKVKGWTILFTTAIFTFAASESVDNRLIWVGLMPVICFWILDGYFLWQERKFRQHYDNVCGVAEDSIDFRMNISDHRLGKSPWIRSIFSASLVVFYTSILLLMITLGVCFLIF